MAETRVVITGDANQAVGEFQRLLAEATGALQNISALGGSTAKVMATIVGAVAAAGAAYLSFGAIVGGVRESIDRLAQLDDSAQKTGSSIVDSLSKLQKVAMMTDVEFGSLDKAVFNLAKSLGTTGDEGIKVRKALADLGITAKDIEGEDTAATFIRVAKSLQNYEDGAGKSAAMNELFKKSAEELMPFMNDVAESVDTFTGRTSEAAAQASGFQDSLGLMKVRTAEMYDVLTDSLLPAISAFTGRLLESDGVISQLSGRVDALGKSGELRRWAENVASSVGYIVDAVVPAMKVAAAYFALFVAAPVIYTAVAAAVSKLVGVLAIYAMNVLIGQTTTIGFNTALFGTSVAANLASGSLTKAGLAANVLFAAYAGWQIGSYLSDNFKEARFAGMTFVAIMLKGWENLKYNLTVAFEAIGFAWDKTIGTMKTAYAGYVSMVAQGLSLVGQDDRAKGVEAFAQSLRDAGGAVGTFADRTAALDAAHKAEIDTIDKNIVEMMAYELTAKTVAKADGAVAEGKKKTLKVSEDNSAAIKAEQDAYIGLITGIKAKIAEARLELALDDNATESQKARIKLDQELASGKLKLTSAHQATVRGLIDEQAAVEKLLKARATEKEVTKYIEQSTLARATSTAQLAAEYQAYGQSSDARDIAMVAIKEQAALEQFLNQQKVAGRTVTDEQIIQLKAEAAARTGVEQAAMAQGKALGYASQLSGENKTFAAEAQADPKARADALLKIDADIWQERIRLAGEGTAAQKILQTEYDTWYKNQSAKSQMGADLTRATELLAVMTALDDVARDAASGMAESFGTVGTAIGGLTTALTGYAKTQAAVAAELAAAMKDAGADPVKQAAAQARAAESSGRAQVRQYADMAGAAKGFFKENSKGYKVLETTEKAYRAYEMAMAVESMLTKSGLLTAFTSLFVASKATETAVDTTTTGTSVVNSGIRAAADGVAAFAKTLASLPFPLNVAAGAAVLALLAGAGVAIAGGGGGGGGPSAKERQATNGTGSILGDSSAKSESIANALEIIAKDSGLGLAHSASMVVSLKQIVSGIGGLGSLLVRTSDIANAADAVASTSSGGFFGGVVSSIFGGKTSVLDTGVAVKAATLGTIASSGVSADAYTDTKKSGGWFSGDKYKTQTQALGSEINNQFAMILTGMGTTITEQATALGLAGEGFADNLNTFKVDLGKISFKDLTGEEQQAALETAFSKVGDDMARYGVAGLENYQKVGEGYLETLARVANDYIQVGDVMAVLGKQFKVTGLDAIALGEGLISAAGDLDTLTSGTSYFVDNFLTEAQKMAPITASVQAEMARLGYASVTTMDQFAAVIVGQADASGQLVGGLDLSVAANQELYASMIAIAPAFQQAAEYANELAEATTGIKVKSASEILSERRDLQDQIDELTMTSAQLLLKQRDALDVSNRALFDQIQALTIAKDAAAAATTGIADARTALTTAYNTEVTALNSVVTAKLAEAAATKKQIDALKLSTNSILSPEQKYAEAMSQFDNASLADKGAAANALLEASRAYNGSTGQYVADYAKVQAALTLSASSATAAATVAQQQLAALDRQVSGLITIDSSITKGAMGVQQAIYTLGTALQAGGKTSDAVGAQTGVISALYQSLLGRAADSSGLAFWQKQASSGATLEQLIAAIKKSPEYVALNGSHANGLAYVPFDGYRAELHKGERVETAAAVRQGDSAAAAAAVAMSKQTAAIERQNSLLERQNVLLEEISANGSSSEDIRGLKQHMAKVLSAKATA